MGEGGVGGSKEGGAALSARHAHTINKTLASLYVQA